MSRQSEPHPLEREREQKQKRERERERDRERSQDREPGLPSDKYSRRWRIDDLANSLQQTDHYELGGSLEISCPLCDVYMGVPLRNVATRGEWGCRECGTRFGLEVVERPALDVID